MVKAISISFVEQKRQRYETIGDWQTDRPSYDTVVVTQLPSDDHSFLIAIHELVEMYLCKKDGITQQQVDEWDKTFEGFSDQEPGEHSQSPYRWQHQRAETVERVLAEILGVDWSFYQKEIDRAMER